MQNAIFAVANLFVQTGVNHFDAVMVSGNSAAQNADTLIFNVMAAFYTACASFYQPKSRRGKGQPHTQKANFISLFYSFAAGGIFGGALLFIRQRVFCHCSPTSLPLRRQVWKRLTIMGWSYAISAFYGLHHCRFKRTGQERGADDHRHHGFVRVQGNMGI